MRRLLLKNRRSSVRHAVQIPCQVVRERDFKLVGDRIISLSESGMVVTPADPVLTGDRLIASFRLPRSGAWIDVEATVTRVSHGRRRGEHTRSFALAFDELSLRSRRMLLHTLRHAPMSPPCPRPGRRSSATALRRLLQSQSAPGVWSAVFSGAAWT
jgi:hypothetical protein